MCILFIKKYVPDDIIPQNFNKFTIKFYVRKPQLEGIAIKKNYGQNILKNLPPELNDDTV